MRLGSKDLRRDWAEDQHLPVSNAAKKEGIGTPPLNRAGRIALHKAQLKQQQRHLTFFSCCRCSFFCSFSSCNRCRVSEACSWFLLEISDSKLQAPGAAQHSTAQHSRLQHSTTPAQEAVARGKKVCTKHSVHRTEVWAPYPSRPRPSTHLQEG